MKLFFALAILIFVQNCSFDNKTGIWKNEKSFSKIEKNIFDDFEDLNTTKKDFNEIIPIENGYNFRIPKAINNYEWKDAYYDQTNNSKNLLYSDLNQLTFKSKKITKNIINNSIFFEEDNIITSDQKGNILVYSIKKKEIVAKYNFYKKKYKKIKKFLNIIVEKNTIYVADNIGYLYAFDYKNKKILWAKKFKIGFRSNVKIFKNKLITSNENNNLFFFNKKNGNILRLIPTEETIIKNKFINNIATNNNLSFFLNTYGSLYAINNQTMQIIWFLNLNQSLDLNPSNLFYSNQIVIEAGKIFVSTNQYIYILESSTGTIIQKKIFHLILNL